jgi:hypothetical protein
VFVDGNYRQIGFLSQEKIVRISNFFILRLKDEDSDKNQKKLCY